MICLRSSCLLLNVFGVSVFFSDWMFLHVLSPNLLSYRVCAPFLPFCYGTMEKALVGFQADSCNYHGKSRTRWNTTLECAMGQIMDLWDSKRFRCRVPQIEFRARKHIVARFSLFRMSCVRDWPALVVALGGWWYHTVPNRGMDSHQEESTHYQG